MQLSNYLKIYPCPDQPGMNLVYSTLRSAVVLLPDELLQAARNGALPDQERDILAQLDILTPDRAAERQRLRTIFDTPRANTPFSAVVVLNLDCNLACHYCYEDAFRGQHYMSAATAALLVETIHRERIEKGQPQRLTFYGGEPLLSLDLIRTIARPLGQAARERGVAFGFSLVTNGTLLNRACVDRWSPTARC
ncbi:MAG: hypothetical protein A2X85_02705 [Geobacteraceae bacterium GWF2_54_21]|nr:MAG: hypothetical protein A2X85_02705 [Geobacteraceae bacterium GWF2_54_21]